MNLLSNDTGYFQNATTSPRTSVTVTKYVVQCLYILAGTSGVLGNLFVIVVICRNKKLHGKIFLLLVSLSVADVFKGVAYLVAGSQRLYLLIIDGMNLQAAPFDCMRQFSTTMFIIGPQAINLMTILVSFDRFIAIALPLVYSRLRKSYALSCIGSCWMAVLVSYIVAWIESSRLARSAKYSRWCIASWSFSPAYNQFAFGFEALSTWVCFLLLVATLVAIRHPPSSNIAVVGRPSYYRRQLKVAKMVLISLSFVVILWALPTNIVFVMTLIGRTKAFDIHVAPTLWLMVAFSGSTNVFVYSVLNKRIREGVKDLISGFQCGRQTYSSVDSDTVQPKTNFRAHMIGLVSLPFSSARSISS